MSKNSVALTIVNNGNVPIAIKGIVEHIDARQADGISGVETALSPGSDSKPFVVKPGEAEVKVLEFESGRPPNVSFGIFGSPVHLSAQEIRGYTVTADVDLFILVPGVGERIIREPLGKYEPFAPVNDVDQVELHPIGWDGFSPPELGKYETVFHKSWLFNGGRLALPLLDKLTGAQSKEIRCEFTSALECDDKGSQAKLKFDDPAKEEP